MLHRNNPLVTPRLQSLPQQTVHFYPAFVPNWCWLSASCDGRRLIAVEEMRLSFRIEEDTSKSKIYVTRGYVVPLIAYVDAHLRRPFRTVSATDPES
jgi:hypothetical protein